MTSIPSDPFAALVHLRIDELRQDAERAALGRAARVPRRTYWSRAATVATSLRESFARPSTGSRAGLPCPTC